MKKYTYLVFWWAHYGNGQFANGSIYVSITEGMMTQEFITGELTQHVIKTTSQPAAKIMSFSKTDDKPTIG